MGTTTAPSTITLPSGVPVPTDFTASSATVNNIVTAQPRANLTTDLWATALIVQLNADGKSVPLTLNNVQNIMRWIQIEGGTAQSGVPSPGGTWLDYNDPLNVRNQSGTFTAPDITSGIAATASTIEQSNMAPILAALQQNASTATFGSALVASPWDAGHYGGKNPLSGVSPTVLYATSTGGNPTGLLGQVGSNLGAVGNAFSPVPAAQAAVGSTASALGAIGTLAGDLTNVTWWKRVGVFTLGAALFVVGLAGFIATTKEGQKVVSEGTSAASLAAVA